MGSGLEALEALADLAPKLKGEAELRVILELSRRQLASPGGVHVSTRDLATACNCGRPNVQKALARLTARNWITRRKGSAVQSTYYRVNLFETVRMGGYVTKPPPTQGRLLSEATPALLHSQGGYDTEPPPLDSKGLAAAAASLDLEFGSLTLIYRVLSAKTKDHDPDDLAAFRNHLHSYYAKFGRDERGRPVSFPHPPPDDIVAQFMAIAEPGRLEVMLSNLGIDAMGAKAHLPDTRSSLNPWNYAWFITLGLSRIHGINFQTTKKVRAALRDVKRRPAPPEPEQIELPNIADLARRKAMP